jgi:signal transduction histidine kinase
MAIGGIAAFGVVLLITTDVFVGQRVNAQLASIRDSDIPLIELGPNLTAQFENLSRALQDAVSARDFDALKATQVLNRNFLDTIAGGAKLVDPALVNKTRIAAEDYYATAYNVSHRLMSKETGLDLLKSMKDMQAKRSKVSELLNKAFIFDKAKLAQAFSAISRSRDAATEVKRMAGLLCLAFVTLVSILISRDILRSLVRLNSGLSRFGAGDFSHLIPESSHDELGEVARQANQMAIKIRTLWDELKEKSLTLELANKELEAFSYSVAHDLRAPIRAMLGFSNALLEDYGSSLAPEAKSMLERVSSAGKRMGQLIDGLLSLSQLSRKEMVRDTVNLSELVELTLETCKESDPKRNLVAKVEKGHVVEGDARLLQVVFTNLVGNAWKFTSKKPETVIEFGTDKRNGQTIFFVRDNGAGFEMKYAEKLFGTFQRLHKTDEFEGTGIGLATVQRIVHRHGGKIWAEAEINKGATFYFTLG